MENDTKLKTEPGTRSAGPIPQSEFRNPQSSAPQSEFRTPQSSVLIVDDNPAKLLALSAALEGMD